MKNNRIIAGVFAFMLISIFSFSFSQKINEDGIYAKFTTNRGEILVKLYAKEAPMTVANFVGLAEGDFDMNGTKFTKPFFDGLKFHRVISVANGDKSDFMIQGGDPEGTGAGGPGYNFYDEFVDTLRHAQPGVLSMANSGPNTNGSQFFITIVPTPWLDGKHTIFGKVISGQFVVNGTMANDVMQKVEIIRVGKDYDKKHWVATDVFKEKYAPLKAKEDEEVKRLEKIAGMSKDDYKKYSFEQAVKLYPEAKQTESGLSYIITNPGEGEKVQAGNKLKVHYTGKLLNGKVFDSSIPRGAPLEFVYKQQSMIPGFEEGLSLLAKGGKATLIIPYFSAYGAMGHPGVIPPYSDLIFEIEVVDIQK